MTPERIAFVLTALAAIVVVLTRVRLSSQDEDAAGRVSIPPVLVNLHTGFGVIALAVWGYFLLADAGEVIGWLGLAAWWVVAIVGVLILLRWLPAQGRHAAGPSSDSWGEGPGLSMIGHIGLVVGSIIWTALLAAGKLG